MKQYTDKDQTAKLIELGFPKPTRIMAIGGFLPKDTLARYASYKDDFDSVTCYEGYSIGELIEFLPLELEPHPDTARRTIVGDEVLYCDEYMDWVELRFNKHKEIIDNLFDACVTLKEEGLI